VQPEEEAREVVERMASLRREITSDVEQVTEQVTQSARAMTDWTFYVRKFPWAAVGVAAAAGFLLVPRKKTSVTPTPEQLAALASSKEFVAAATQQLKPPEGLLKGLAATLVVRHRTTPRQSRGPTPRTTRGRTQRQRPPRNNRVLSIQY
jgi:hypothetical protein